MSNRSATHAINAALENVQTTGIAHPLVPNHSVMRGPVDDSSGTSGPIQLTPQDSDEGHTLQSSPFTSSSDPAMGFTPEEALSDQLMSHTAGQAITHPEDFLNVIQPREAFETPQPGASGKLINVDGYLNPQDQPFHEASPGE